MVDPNTLQDSLILNFIKKQKDFSQESLIQSLEDHGWMRDPFDILNDLHCQNVLEDCMNYEKNELIFKILFEHAF